MSAPIGSGSDSNLRAYTTMPPAAPAAPASPQASLPSPAIMDEFSEKSSNTLLILRQFLDELTIHNLDKMVQIKNRIMALDFALLSRWTTFKKIEGWERNGPVYQKLQETLEELQKMVCEKIPETRSGLGSHVDTFNVLVKRKESLIKIVPILKLAMAYLEDYASPMKFSQLENDIAVLSLRKMPIHTQHYSCDIECSIPNWSKLTQGEWYKEIPYSYDTRHRFLLKIVKGEVDVKVNTIVNGDGSVKVNLNVGDTKSAPIGMFCCYNGPSTQEKPVSAYYQLMIKDLTNELRAAQSSAQYFTQFWNKHGMGFTKFTTLADLESLNGYNRKDDKITFVCRVILINGIPLRIQPQEFSNPEFLRSMPKKPTRIKTDAPAII